VKYLLPVLFAFLIQSCGPLPITEPITDPGPTPTPNVTPNPDPTPTPTPDSTHFQGGPNATVLWTAPIDSTGFTITGYRVYLRDDTLDPLGAYATTDVPGVTMPLSNLIFGHTYSLYVTTLGIEIDTQIASESVPTITIYYLVNSQSMLARILRLR